MNDKQKKVLQYLSDFLWLEDVTTIQTFNSRNTAGDEMITIYDEDGIQVDYCENYTYLEIFGFTDEEFYELLEGSNGLLY